MQREETGKKMSTVKESKTPKNNAKKVQDEAALSAAELLRGERRPGPSGVHDPDLGDKTLSDAARVLRLIASGALKNEPMEAPRDIPKDIHGNRFND